VVILDSLSVEDGSSHVHNLDTTTDHVLVDSDSLASMPSLEDVTSIENNCSDFDKLILTIKILR